MCYIPEIYLCAALLAILYYATGPAVNVFCESMFFNPRFLCVPLAYKESFNPDPYSPDGGPSAAIPHVCIWAASWCFLGAALVWHTPLPALQAGGVFLRDSFSIGAGASLLFFAGIVTLMSTYWSLSAKIVITEYVALILLSVLGMFLLCSAVDLTAVYLCLELQSFSLVVLCSLNYHSAYAVEAGIKYFLLSAFSSCLLLLGVGLVYMDAGTTNIHHLQEYYQSLCPNLSVSSLLGVWLISLGLLWKLAAAPLHFWAADVYQGSWTSVSLLISTLPKISVLSFWVHHWHLLWTVCFANTLFWFSAGSLLIGAIAPLAQVQLKRLLAFSSVGHMGFMLMPLVGGSEGYSSLVVYLFFYIVTSLVTWGLLMWPLNLQNIKNGGPQYVWDLSGLNQALPTAAAAWAVGMLSLAGLPPAAGFLGKLGLFWWGLNAHQYSLVLLALAATLLSSVYYFRVLKVSYVENPKGWGVYYPLSTLTSYVVAVSVLILVLGLWHGSPIVLLAHLLCLNVSYFL